MIIDLSILSSRQKVLTSMRLQHVMMEAAFTESAMKYLGNPSRENWKLLQIKTDELDEAVISIDSCRTALFAIIENEIEKYQNKNYGKFKRQSN